METITKDNPQYDQWMQMTVMDYVIHLERGGQVDEAFEKELEDFLTNN